MAALISATTALVVGSLWMKWGMDAVVWCQTELEAPSRRVIVRCEEERSGTRITDDTVEVGDGGRDKGRRGVFHPT